MELMQSLTDNQVEGFVTEGFARLDNAFTRPQAMAATGALFTAAGIDADDPTRWPGPVHRIGGSRDGSVVACINTPRLTGAIDQLVGRSSWLPRTEGYGTFPIRFPSLADPGDAGWHIDGSFGGAPDYRVNFESRGRALLLLMLFTDVGPDDAPTRIRVGSHQPVARALRHLGTDVGGFSPEQHCPDSLDLPVELAVGSAGAVYLCHPFLVHAASWPHRGTGPRVVAQPCIHHPEGEGQGAFDYDVNPEIPVKRAVRLAVG